MAWGGVAGGLAGLYFSGSGGENTRLVYARDGVEREGVTG